LKTINARLFLKETKNSVDAYATALEDNQNNDHWNQFKKKMSAICANCG
jgi:ribosomal protein L7/L12